MAIELEIKLMVASHEPVRDALMAAGAERLSRVLEFNTLLDRPDAALRAKREALRVREYNVLDGPPRMAEITHKSPGPSSKFKSRQEREVLVNDAKAAVSIFHALGFVDVLSFEKRRESWRLDGCLVELDELPILGFFVEVEGPNEKTIETLRAKLGLGDLDHVKPSYVSMLSKLHKQGAVSTRDIRFAN